MEYGFLIGFTELTLEQTDTTFFVPANKMAEFEISYSSGSKLDRHKPAEFWTILCFTPKEGSEYIGTYYGNTSGDREYKSNDGGWTINTKDGTKNNIIIDISEIMENGDRKPVKVMVGSLLPR